LGVGIGLHGLLKLEEERRILVPREETEQYAVRQLERPSRPEPCELQQPAILRNGADVLDSLSRRRPQTQQIASPYSVVFLLLHYREGTLGFGDRLMSGLDRLRGHIP